MLRSESVRRFAIALSLANICFVDVWGRVLGLDIWDNFYRGIPHARVELVTLPVVVLLVAALFWAAATLAMRTGRIWIANVARISFLLVTIFLLIHCVAYIWTPWVKSLFRMPTIHPSGVATAIWLLIHCVVLATVIWIVIHPRRFSHFASAGLLILLPFVGITFAQAGWALVRYPHAAVAASFREPPLAREGATSPHPRVVWILFDGMDQGFAFSRRPATWDLPELDHLRAESVYATHATSPALCTQLSIPSLLLGQQIDSLHPSDSSNLTVRLASTEKSIDWQSADNVFRLATQQGTSTAVVGWFLPYCRILNEQELSYCWWSPISWTPENSSPSSTTTVWKAAFRQAMAAASLFIDDASDTWLRNKRCERDAKSYVEILARAKSVASDPRYGLVYIHLPVPHSPGISIEGPDRVQCSDYSELSDNYDLVNRALGEIRAAMEAAHQWDDSIVVVTSDHPYRDWVWGPAKVDDQQIPHTPDSAYYSNIPMLLKLAGQHEEVVYDRQFNTLILKDLILSMLRGDIRTPSQVVGAIESNPLARAVSVPKEACLALW